MRAGDVDVDLPVVSAALHRAQAADGVHQQQSRSGGHQFAEGGKVVSHAGTRFAQRRQNRGGVGMVRQRLGELLRLDRLAVGIDDVHRFHFEGFRDVAEALAKAPGDQADGLALRRKRVDDGRFQPAGARAG